MKRIQFIYYHRQLLRFRVHSMKCLKTVAQLLTVKKLVRMSERALNKCKYSKTAVFYRALHCVTPHRHNLSSVIKGINIWTPNAHPSLRGLLHGSNGVINRLSERRKNTNDQGERPAVRSVYREETLFAIQTQQKRPMPRWPYTRCPYVIDTSLYSIYPPCG